MNRKKTFQKTCKVRFVLCGALLGTLTGCVGYVDQPRPRAYYPEPPRPSEVYAAAPSVQIGASVGAVEVAIRAESDFYEPLNPYGRWEVVGSYGRCWIPSRVERDWRPYCNGYWQRTDAGWYWASDEPWGWATYHYGRWDFGDQFGWFWVPQIVWAPAWVSWHSGGGYVGWAPLSPSVRIAASGSVDVNVRVIAPRAYVFVEERRFLEPVRPTTVVVNNTTIINKTVNITNIKVVNNTVINEGPHTTVIEQASGRKIQPVPVRELRHKQEAAAVARQRTVPPAAERKIQTPVRSEADPRGKNPQLDSERRAIESKTKVQAQPQSNPRELEQKAARLESERRANEGKMKAQEQSQKNVRELQQKAAQAESERRANESRMKVQGQSQKNARDSEQKAAQVESERRANEGKIKAQGQSQKNAKELQQKSAQAESERRVKDAAAKAHEELQRDARGSEKNAPQVSKQPAKEAPPTNEKGAAKLLKNDRQKKGKGKPSPPENPTVPPPASP